MFSLLSKLPTQRDVIPYHLNKKPSEGDNRRSEGVEGGAREQEYSKRENAARPACRDFTYLTRNLTAHRGKTNRVSVCAVVVFGGAPGIDLVKDPPGARLFTRSFPPRPPTPRAPGGRRPQIASQLSPIDVPSDSRIIFRELFRFLHICIYADLKQQFVKNRYCACVPPPPPPPLTIRSAPPARLMTSLLHSSLSPLYDVRWQVRTDCTLRVCALRTHFRPRIHDTTDRNNNYTISDIRPSGLDAKYILHQEQNLQQKRSLDESKHSGSSKIRNEFYLADTCRAYVLYSGMHRTYCLLMTRVNA
ncbi:unnamed protein product [Leptosia nina]|uniref:Uncharacterized protein n=1 Tax=Leptosia nina TaxID=320188 RepID=A0AAV1J7C6_9NEOP